MSGHKLDQVAVPPYIWRRRFSMAVFYAGWRGYCRKLDDMGCCAQAATVVRGGEFLASKVAPVSKLRSKGQKILDFLTESLTIW